MKNEEGVYNLGDVDLKKTGDNTYNIRYTDADGRLRDIKWSSIDGTNSHLDAEGIKAIYRVKIFLGLQD